MSEHPEQVHQPANEFELLCKAVRAYTKEREYQNVEHCRRDQDRLEQELICACNEAEKALSVHQSKQERMREALEFYARRHLYPPFDNSYPSLTEDRGKRARAALSDVTEQKQILSDKPRMRLMSRLKRWWYERRTGFWFVKMQEAEAERINAEARYYWYRQQIERND